MQTVTVKVFASRYEADIALQHLASYGIEALLSSPDAGGQLPNMQMSSGVLVQVAPSDVDRAVELLRELDGGPESDSLRLSTRERVQSVVVGLVFVAAFLAFVFYLAQRALESGHPAPS